MYLYFHNAADLSNSILLGPCSFFAQPGKLFVMDTEDNERTEVPQIDGLFVVDGKTFEVCEHVGAGEIVNRATGVNKMTFEQFLEIQTRLKEFTPHGVYSWSNCCGCEVELSNDVDAARLRFNFGEVSESVTEWLPIEYVETEDGNGHEHVIDPERHNVPLSLVMRIN